MESPTWAVLSANSNAAFQASESPTSVGTPASNHGGVDVPFSAADQVSQAVANAAAANDIASLASQPMTPLTPSCSDILSEALSPVSVASSSGSGKSEKRGSRTLRKDLENFQAGILSSVEKVTKTLLSLVIM